MDSRLEDIESLAERGGHFGRVDLMAEAVGALVGIVRELRAENRILKFALSDIMLSPFGFPMNAYAEAERKLRALDVAQATVKPATSKDPAPHEPE